MRAVVITGASTGIGRASALWLDRRGFHVFAGVRKEADAEALRASASQRLVPLTIDITDEESIVAASRLVSEKVRDVGLSGLVNNAGTTVPCPVEYLPLEEFRRQLEVNLVGHLAVVKAFLPRLLEARGRIVNVTSVGGKLAVPFMAPYAAGKHGLEGLSDVLRLELEPLGMRVSIIEPGSVSTQMRHKLDRDTKSWLGRLPDQGRARYGAPLEALMTAISRHAAHGSSPDVIARAVEHALTSRRPKTRYAVASGAKRLITLRRVLPDRWTDRLVVRTLGVRST